MTACLTVPCISMSNLKAGKPYLKYPYQQQTGCLYP